VGGFQPKQTGDYQQNRSREEQENTHAGTIYRKAEKAKMGNAKGGSGKQKLKYSNAAVTDATQRPGFQTLKSSPSVKRI
jgi:hypothetical protein